MSGVRQQVVARDEDGMRLDKWFGIHFPGISFGLLQKFIRTGQIRVDSGRVKTSTRLGSGQVVRVPPVEAAIARPGPEQGKPRAADASFLRALVLYEDEDIYVFNKPHGLASQGGTGIKRSMDSLLKSLPNKKGEAPRLVHRLDRDTSGCLVVAKTRAVASYFGTVFRSRSARKIYWAIVAGNPSPKQGRISCFLAKQATTYGEQMVVVPDGTEGAVHSVSYYSVTDIASRRFAWVTLKPVTGRTHQLRVHMAQLGTPILGDPRYFDIENWEPPEGLATGLHLHARRISVPMRSGRRLDVSAPLPEHMEQTFAALGFDAGRYDIQDEDPEEA